MYERQLLRELESLRPDIANSNAKVASKPNGIPKPTVIPPLEDDSNPSRPAVPGPSLTRGPPSIPSSAVSGRPGIGQASVPQSSIAGPSKPPVATPQSLRPPLASQNVSPGAAPAKARGNEPPLGGRFADGTKSMFIQPSFPSPSAQVQGSASSTAVPRSSNTDPLLGSPLMSSDPIQRPGTTDGTSRGAGDVDPLGGIRPAYMSASVRVQPMRRKLDAREAASKLANMF